MKFKFGSKHSSAEALWYVKFFVTVMRLFNIFLKIRFEKIIYEITVLKTLIFCFSDSLKVDDVYEISRMDVVGNFLFLYKTFLLKCFYKFQLSEQIMEFHESVEQTQETLNLKLNLRDMLYYTIAPIFPSKIHFLFFTILKVLTFLVCGLYIIGSSLNGFGNNKSDMDLCLMITNRDVCIFLLVVIKCNFFQIDQRTDAVTVLSSISRTIENTKLVADQQLILAKVPILRIKFHGAYSNITVDLNVNNSVAIRNTHLLCYYSSCKY